MSLPRLYSVPVSLVLEAISPEQAQAQAHVLSHLFTAAARLSNSSFVQDNVTITSVAGPAQPIESAPAEPYDREYLTEVYGEDRAIRFLRHATSVLRD